MQMQEIEKNQPEKASKLLIGITVASMSMVFIALYTLLWSKWGLVTFMKLDFWSLCF